MMLSEMGPFVDVIFLLLLLPFFVSPGIFNMMAYARFVCRAIMAIASYLVTVTYLSAYTFFLAALFVAFCSLLQWLNGPVICKNYIIQRLEREMRAQLYALREEERKVAEQVKGYTVAITEWETTNADIMKQIRIVEQAIKKKTRDFEPYPERVVIRPDIYMPWRKPLMESSSWSFVRWLKGQTHPEVFEAIGARDWRQMRFEVNQGQYAYLISENERLDEALRAATAKKNALRRQPDLMSGSTPAWYQRHLDETELRQRQQRREAQAQAQLRAQPVSDAALWYSVRLARAEESRGEMLHVCHDCGSQGWHNWLCEYSTIAAAANSSFHAPCPVARARWANLSMETFNLANLANLQPVPAPTSLLSAPLPVPSSAPLFRELSDPVVAAPTTLPATSTKPAPAPTLFPQPVAEPARTFSPPPVAEPAPIYALAPAPTVPSLASIITPAAAGTTTPPVPAPIFPPLPVAEPTPVPTPAPGPTVSLEASLDFILEQAAAVTSTPPAPASLPPSVAAHVSIPTPAPAPAFQPQPVAEHAPIHAPAPAPTVPLAHTLDSILEQAAAVTSTTPAPAPLAEDAPISAPVPAPAVPVAPKLASILEPAADVTSTAPAFLPQPVADHAPLPVPVPAPAVVPELAPILETKPAVAVASTRPAPEPTFAPLAAANAGFTFSCEAFVDHTPIFRPLPVALNLAPADNAPTASSQHVAELAPAPEVPVAPSQPSTLETKPAAPTVVSMPPASAPTFATFAAADNEFTFSCEAFTNHTPTFQPLPVALNLASAPSTSPTPAAPATPPSKAGRSLRERSTLPSVATPPAASPAAPAAEVGLLSPTFSELERELAREEADGVASLPAASLAASDAEVGLASPTSSDLERELAREEEEADEEEKESRRKEKGKGKMTAEESEALEWEREVEREKARELERAMQRQWKKYRDGLL